MVRSIDGDPETGFTVETNDGESGPLDCGTLAVGDDNAIYCEVLREGRGRLQARFMRPPYYHLMSFVEQTDSGVVLSCAGETFPLQSRSPSA